MKNIFLICLGALYIGMLWSCDKFLDEKSDVALAIPTTLEELDDMMNFYREFVDDPNAGEVATDDFYVLDNDLNGINSEDAKNIYRWSDNVFLEDDQNDWRTVYNGIYYCNLVLEKLDELEKNEKIQDRSRFNKVRGEALFMRARRYLHAALVWCLAYDAASADTDLGLPLRLGSNFNEKVGRSSLQKTYERIISDLKLSAQLLPEKPVHKVKASRPAALAILARTYLSMRDYDSAFRYADSTLQHNNILLDFNELDINQSQPIYAFNDEVIMSTILRSQSMFSRARLKVNNELVDLFEEDDLRKLVFFFQNPDNTYGFKSRFGTEGGTVMFSGPAVNEMYLIRAESSCRSGEVGLALEDMNKLLKSRYRSGRFVALDKDMDARELLEIILKERRKDLLYRGIRWMDVKRLNIEGHNIQMSRIIGEHEYVLPANDKRTAMMIPRTVVELGGIEQNWR